jgi:hypothetical protein
MMEAANTSETSVNFVKLNGAKTRKTLLQKDLAVAVGINSW